MTELKRKLNRLSSRLRVVFHCPCSTGLTRGNAISANRIAVLLRELGCEVQFDSEGRVGGFDVAIAQNACKSQAFVSAWQKQVPTIVIISGTEMLGSHSELEQWLSGCSRAVVGCAELRDALPISIHIKTVVIPKSCILPAGVEALGLEFREPNVTVIGHVRAVKRSLDAGLAARKFSKSSQLQVNLIGDILDSSYRQKIANEEAANPRFRWLGNLSRADALNHLRRGIATVNSSSIEGGANSIAEAILLDVPIVATRIPANVGCLGPGHPGLYEPGDLLRLAELLERLETEKTLRQEFLEHQEARKLRFDPAREREGWRALLQGFI